MANVIIFGDLSVLDDPKEIDDLWKEIALREKEDEEFYQEYLDWSEHWEVSAVEDRAAWDDWLDSPEGIAAKEAYEKEQTEDKRD